MTNGRWSASSFADGIEDDGRTASATAQATIEGRQMKKLWIVTFLAIAVVTAHAQEPNEPPGAQQIETLLLKRFPGMNRVLWLDGNTKRTTCARSGPTPHNAERTSAATCRAVLAGPLLLWANAALTVFRPAPAKASDWVCCYGMSDVKSKVDDIDQYVRQIRDKLGR